MAAETLSLVDEAPEQPPQIDHLYLALAAGRPAASRWCLGGTDRIEVGRGDELGVRATARTLRINIPDAWMSEIHVVFERELAHWIAIDAGSRNGFLVNGTKQTRALVLGHDVVEIGRSILMLRDRELQGPAELSLTPSPLATLVPELASDLAELMRIAATALPVMIHGATGTGKERIATAIHQQSRRSGPLVAVNCGALPPALIESELFGYRRGAFTGAIGDHAGMVASSSGGTLFLDEIADLPTRAQAALLRVLEEHEVRALGATTVVPVDLRLVCATHHDLDDMVSSGEFRSDLLGRIAGFRVELPALADRRVDLGLILASLLPKGTSISREAARAIFAYDWPRNIRELVMAIAGATALGDGEIRLEHLPPKIAAAQFNTIAQDPDARRDVLIAQLEKHRGNVTKVALELGRARQQVQRWLVRYGISAANYR